RSRTEQNEAGCFPFLQSSQQGMNWLASAMRDLPAIVARELHGVPDLCHLHQSLPAAGDRGCQWNDDISVEYGGQQQGADIRRIVAADSQRAARIDAGLRHSREPRIGGVT